MHAIGVSFLCGASFLLGAVLMLGVSLMVFEAKNKGMAPALKDHWDKSLDLSAKVLAQQTRIASSIDVAIELANRNVAKPLAPGWFSVMHWKAIDEASNKARNTPGDVEPLDVAQVLKNSTPFPPGSSNS